MEGRWWARWWALAFGQVGITCSVSGQDLGPSQAVGVIQGFGSVRLRLCRRPQLTAGRNIEPVGCASTAEVARHLLEGQPGARLAHGSERLGGVAHGACLAGGRRAQPGKRLWPAVLQDVAVAEPEQLCGALIGVTQRREVLKGAQVVRRMACLLAELVECLAPPAQVDQASLSAQALSLKMLCTAGDLLWLG